MLVQLTAEPVRLLLHRGFDTDWTRLTISWPGNAWFAGAESWPRLVAGLDSALRPREMEAAGKIEGTEVFAGFTLSEAHGSLYIATAESGLTWFWQDSDAHIVGVIEVDHGTAHQWSQTLRSVSD